MAKLHSNQSVSHCSKCGQKLPKKIDMETMKQFEIMTDIWIKSLLTERRNSNE